MRRCGTGGGNPGGRPPLTPDQRLARQIIHEDSAVNARWMIRTRDDPDVPWDIRMRCAERLDDREHGKPAQSIGVAHLTPRVTVQRRRMASCALS
jgi:hypothetical protein